MSITVKLSNYYQVTSVQLPIDQSDFANPRCRLHEVREVVAYLTVLTPKQYFGRVNV